MDDEARANMFRHLKTGGRLIAVDAHLTGPTRSGRGRLSGSAFNMCAAACSTTT